MSTAHDRAKILKKKTDEIRRIAARSVEDSEKTKRLPAAKKKKSELQPPSEDEADHDTDSEDPNELMIYQSEENIHLLDEVKLARLARMSFRHHLWGSKLDSYFVFLAYLSGYDVMSSFAFYLNKFGSAFVMFYVLSMFAIGFPCFYMEMALGQYSSYSAYNVFERISPAMKGVGFLALLINFLLIITDQMIVPYFMTLWQGSTNFFADGVSWHHCFDSYNDDDCRELNHSCESLQAEYSEVSNDIAKRLGLYYSQMGSLCLRSRLHLLDIDEHERWDQSTLHELPIWKWFGSESMGQHLFWNLKLTQNTIRYFTWPTYEFIVYTFVSWAAVYLIYLAGKKAITVLTKLTTFFTIGVLGTCLIHFLITDNGSDRFLGRITETKFDDVGNILPAAIFMTLSSLKLGQGGVIYLGSRYPFRNSLGKDCLIIVLASILIPFAYAVCHSYSIDSYLLQLLDGDLAKYHQLSQNAHESFFYSSGHRIINFMSFVQSLRIWKGEESSLICLFSAMGILLTVINKVVRLDILIAAIVEIFPIFTERNGRQMLLHLLICVAYLCMFFFVSSEGLEHLIGFEGLTVPFVVGSVLMAEVVTVIYFYGGRRLFVNIMAMDTQRNQQYESRWSYLSTKLLALFMWGCFIPYAIGTALAHKMSKDYKQYSEAPWVLSVVLVSIIPTITVFMALASYRRSNNWKLIFLPDVNLWAPRAAEDRLHAERLERKYRVS